MKKFTKSKYRYLYIGLSVALAVLLVAGLSMYVPSEIKRSRNCINVRTDTGEKVRRCANGYVGLPVVLAEKKAESNGLWSFWYDSSDKNSILAGVGGPQIQFDVRHGIVVDAQVGYF